MILYLICLAGLCAASVQDFLFGEVTKLVYYVTGFCLTMYLVYIGMGNAIAKLLFTGIVYLVIKYTGLRSSWGGADTCALLLVTLSVSWNNLVFYYLVIGASTTLYTIYLTYIKKREETLYVIPGITAGYLTALIITLI